MYLLTSVHPEIASKFGETFLLFALNDSQQERPQVNKDYEPWWIAWYFAECALA
jgi:hypothetical protein